METGIGVDVIGTYVMETGIRVIVLGTYYGDRHYSQCLRNVLWAQALESVCCGVKETGIRFDVTGTCVTRQVFRVSVSDVLEICVIGKSIKS
jgi:hypothetical protein